MNCSRSGSAENLQGYLEGYFDRPELFRRCKQRLRQVANLRMYTTPIAMDDLDELRQAMGYRKINLIGGSYGTRAALVYLRRHGEHVRTAVLNGVDAPAAVTAVYYAQSAQEAIELIFEECAQDYGCAAAFPALEQEFGAVLRRLERSPEVVHINHPDSGSPATVELTRHAFAEAVRGLMYSPSGSRWLPYLIHLAYQGTFWPITEFAVELGRGRDDAVSWGMMLTVTCSEEGARFDPADIPRLTENTFLGDHLLRTVLEVCELWPTAVVPDSYYDPIASEVPVLLLSGTQDPVSPAKFADEAARHLANGLHLVVPGGHHVEGPCIDAIIRRFVMRGSVEGLNTSCAAEIQLPAFELP